MPHLFRRTLTLLTVATLALGATAVTLSPSQAAEVNVIPDSALRQCIVDAMRGAGTGASPGHPDYATEAESISKDDLQALLNAWYSNRGSGEWSGSAGGNWDSGLYCIGVSSLNGLETLSGLQHVELLDKIELVGSNVSDLTPLVGLTSLKGLYLGRNQITDITPLQGLVELQKLNLSGNEISDLSKLASLINLKELNLNSNDISDVSLLGGLTSLTGLNLSNNPINDISPLTTLTLLETLFLTNDEIRDSSPLSTLTSLTHLELSINDLTAIPTLSGNVTFAPGFTEVAPGRLFGVWAGVMGPSLIHAGINHISSVVDQVPNLCTSAQLDWFRDANEHMDLWDELITTAPRCVSFYGPFQELTDTAIQGTTSLPSVVGFPGEPLTWRVAQGAATINGNQVTYPTAGTYVLQFESKSDEELTWYWADEEEEWMTKEWCDLQNGAYDGPLPYDPNYGPGVHWCTIDAEYSGIVTVTVTDEVNVIPDPALRECIATAMHNAGTGASPGHPDYATEVDSISKDDLQALLNAWYTGGWWSPGISCSGVASLEGLDVIAGLDHADVIRSFRSVDGTITELTPLAGLTSLQNLSLFNNQISDISGLSGLSYLDDLNLSNNQIDNVSALAGLTRLSSDLDLSDNQIDDVSPLAGLTRLYNLDLSGNRITDISHLAGLTQLTGLALSSNQIVDVSPLTGLTALHSLNLSNNKVADISSLAGLFNATGSESLPDGTTGTYRTLGRVSFNGNQITDLSFLARDADGQVRAGDTAGLASEYAGSWGGFMGQTTPVQTAVAGTTVALPVVLTASDSVYPIVWNITAGDAVINTDGTITYNSAGPVQLAWSNPMPAASGDPYVGSETTVTVSTFTGIVAVNVTAAPGVPVEPSAPDSDADKDTVVATTTGGAARLADGQDSYTITAVVNASDGTPLTGFAGLLTSTTHTDITVGAWTDNGDGTYSALVTSATPGNYVVSVVLDGTTIGTIPVNFIAATISETVRLLAEAQQADAFGFLPGEEVQVTVHSDPIDLGRINANGVGTVSVDFTVPANFALGRHTVTFKGATSGTVVVAFDVVASSSAGASTGGVALEDESAPMGIALAVTCLIAAGFAFAMTRPRPARAMRAIR